jgi:alkylhydroperoxidase family enzyme
MSYLKPLSPEKNSEIYIVMENFKKNIGFIPNSVMTMVRCPEILKGLNTLSNAIMNPNSTISIGFKKLLGFFASKTSGCEYCQAHALVAAKQHGISQEKLDDIWEYKTSQYYNDAEKSAINLAIASASIPNEVNENIINDVLKYWTEIELIELISAIALYGFLERWNSSLATQLEDSPTILATKLFDQHGINWNSGKHK